MTADLVDVERTRRWLDGRRGGDQLRRWADRHPALTGWTTGELLDPAGSASTDAMQASLVAVAQAGDGEAAILLLTQLRPGLCRIVSSVSGVGPRSWSRPEAVDEVRAAFFETVYRHRLDRRPRKIAANLVLDTRQRVVRWQRRSGREAAADPARQLAGTRGAVAATTATGDPLARLAVTGTIREAVARLPGSASSRRLSADLAFRAWILEQPRAVIADDLGVGARAVATRLHRLRALVDRSDLLG